MNNDRWKKPSCSPCYEKGGAQVPTAVPDTAPSAGITQQEVGRVIAALEDSQYKWRTVQGVAKDANLPEERVRQIIDYLQAEGVVIQSSIDAEDGSELFTTRLHRRQTASLWHRFMAALRVSAD